MKLHEDKYSFLNIIALTHEICGIREDIDLTVCIDGCSNSQAKRRLELSTKKYKCLPRTIRKDLEDDRKGSITAVYDYSPVVTVDEKDPLQRFGYVKVEGTSFTISEPYSPLEVDTRKYSAHRNQNDSTNVISRTIKSIHTEKPPDCRDPVAQSTTGSPQSGGGSFLHHIGILPKSRNIVIST